MNMGISIDEMSNIKFNIARALKILDTYDNYKGLLLCEGLDSSVDCKLYSAVYPNLLVTPSCGNSSIQKYISIYRKRMCGYPVYGIIDRDSLSKSQIRRLKKKGIYCTKLPFIENIISTPEVLEILCENMGLEYEPRLKFLKQKLIGLLLEDLLNVLPINISLGTEVISSINGEYIPVNIFNYLAGELKLDSYVSTDDDIDSTRITPITAITIKIVKENGQIVEKTVNEDNIMYTYRDKAVANELACAIGVLGRKRYYQFFSECLDNPIMKDAIVKSISRYLPKIGE